MNIRYYFFGLTVSCGFALSVSAIDAPALDPHLEPLRPWLGKTFKSEAKESSGKPVIDVSRWERALNGKAVRILHSINNGSYGGESIVIWDEQKQTVGYHYFTTAGFRTEGTIEFRGGKLITDELIKGTAQGVTEVRGTTEMHPDGTFYTKTEYLKEGKWTPGREAVYREDAAASVIFK
jgi:hypothetical protein